MKNFIFFFCLLANLSMAQETEYISAYKDYHVGQRVYLFGNNVHLRDAPNTSGNKLSLLPIGSELIIQEDYTTNYTNNPFWLKVKHDGIIGYLRSDFLSQQTFEIDGIPHYARIKETEPMGSLQIRIPTTREPAYIEKEFEVFTNHLTIEVLDNKGLNNVNHVVHFNYIAEACGVDGGGKYIFIDASNQWIDAFDYTQVGDGGVYFYWEEIKFPSEHKEGNFIQYTSELFEMIEEGNDYDHPIHTEKHITERVLHWNGKTILPKFNQQPSDDF